MRFRQRSTRPEKAALNEDSSAERLDDSRLAGEELLRAADDAIERALSSDSEAFLRANRQQGGQ